MDGNRMVIGFRCVFGCMVLLAAGCVSRPADPAAGLMPRGFRPPAVPLVAVDPFFSVWSRATRLTSDETFHWSGAYQPMTATLTVDGRRYCLLGDVGGVPALHQISCEVRPTQTVCRFEDAAVTAELVFSTPALPDDLDLLSRPVTYVTCRAAAKDGARHDFSFAYTIDGHLATNDDKAKMETRRYRLGDLDVLKIGRAEQKPLSASGDQVRCDWGYACLATGTLAARGADFSAHVILAYDDIESVSYLGHPLKAWWRRNGLSFDDLLVKSEADYPALMRRMAAFDARTLAEAVRLGGPKYAALVGLSHRQSLAACKLVAGPDGEPLYFSKENGSNGCIGTVDVFYPQFPHLLAANPALARATLRPLLDFAASPRWSKPYAPHDLGVYPLADRPINDGSDPKTDIYQMPVEECGNMLICLGALSTAEGNADFAGRWWPLATKWAEYLAQNGLDPAYQLCTDDFGGHLAHNANLSAKAILGLACYARMAAMRGDAAAARSYRALAERFAAAWVRKAAGGAEGATRLAFDKPGTWSLKYNLVWDRVLGLDLFPPEVARREMAAYRKFMLTYGVPLDCRNTWTKADWMVWTAMLTGDRGDFDAFIAALYKFADETENRIPFTDYYGASNAVWQSFVARSVVGGLFMPFLADELGRRGSAR